MCGGVKTEPQYFAYVNDVLDAVGVKIVLEKSGRSPKSLLDRAIYARERETKAAKASGDARNRYNAVWIVCDVDDFAVELATVRATAANEDIHMAISNPCFELWLLWHQNDQEKFLSTHAVQDAAKKAGVVTGKDGKDLNRTSVEGRYDAARKRAQRASAFHERNSTAFPQNNPDSGVVELVESIRASVAKARPGSTISL